MPSKTLDYVASYVQPQVREAIDDLAWSRRTSRAEQIRRALNEYLAHEQAAEAVPLATGPTP